MSFREIEESLEKENIFFPEIMNWEYLRSLIALGKIVVVKIENTYCMIAQQSSYLSNYFCDDSFIKNYLNTFKKLTQKDKNFINPHLLKAIRSPYFYEEKRITYIFDSETNNQKRICRFFINLKNT